MLEHAVRIEVPGRTLDIVGTGGDRVAHREHLDDVRPRRRRRRDHRRQARQPRRVVVVRARPTCSRRSASGSTTRPRASRSSPPRSASPSASRRCSTRRSGTPPRPAPSWASGRPSTSSVRSPTRRSRGPPRSASPTPGWRRSWRGSSPARGSSALVFRGEDGLDEIAADRSDPALGGAGRARHRVGRSTGRRTSASRGSRSSRCVAAKADYNADVARRLLDGEPGPVRETVVLNTAAALVADGTLPARTARSTRRARRAARCGRASGARAADGAAQLRAAAAATCSSARWRRPRVRGPSDVAACAPGQSSSPRANACSRSCCEYVRNAM